MSFTLRDFGLKHLRPWCDGKKRHKSFGAAEAHRRGLVKFAEEKGRLHKLEGLVSYRCTTCGFYHVGHKRSKTGEKQAGK